MSGNTESVANYIADGLREAGHSVDCAPIHQSIDLNDFDCLLLGTPTIGDGDVPDAMVECVNTINDVEGFPVSVFGTGDTQWGNSFCFAVDRIIEDMQTSKMCKPMPSLKIEQNLFMKSQKDKADEYISKVISVIEESL